MLKRSALLVTLVAVVVVAEDYYYNSDLCDNIQPGLWVSESFFLSFFLF